MQSWKGRAPMEMTDHIVQNPRVLQEDLSMMVLRIVWLPLLLIVLKVVKRVHHMEAIRIMTNRYII